MEHVLVHLFNLLRTLLARAARRIRRRLRRLHKDHWVEVPAKIDVVSVVDWPEPCEFIKTYFGVLTYFYRNPDLHTGDYEVEFADRWQAQSWANQFKGLHVMVRVNPRDPDDSVMLHLPALPRLRARPLVAPTRPASLEAPKSVILRALSPGQKTWAENCRLLSAAGVGASAVVLSLNIASGGRARSDALFWLGGCLLTLALCSSGVLSLCSTTERSLRAVRRLHGAWVPPRLVRLLIASGVILAGLVLYSGDRTQLYTEARSIIGAHLPYLVALWGFLVSWALHDSVLRSQRNVAAHS